MADAVALAPAPTRKQKRWGRRLVVAFVLLLVLLAVGVWAAPGLIARSSYRHKLIADATKDLNGKVEVGAVSLAWLHPVELFDVTVTDPDGRPVLTAAKVSTSRTLLDFARDRSDLGVITVEHPRLDVVVENGTTNVERAIAKYLADPTPPQPDRTPIRIEVTDGTAVLVDPAKNETRQLDAVAVTVGVPKSRSESVTLAVAAKSAGKVKADCTFGDGGTVKLTAAGFDAAALGPILRRFDPAAVARGTLTADLTADWKPGAVAANGTASVSGMSLGGAWLGSDVLKLQAVQLTPARFSYAGGKLTVESAKLVCDAGTAEFAGTLDTAAPDKLLEQTGLKLDADVDVAAVARLLPSLLRVKPGTELTSGRLTVKAASAAGPTGPTWAGSVSTTRLEGKRDGKPLVWDKPLAVTFQGRVRIDGLPVFDDLTVASDFIGARARGEPEQFTAAVNLELDKLAAHLHDFLDLDGLQLGGSVRNLIVRTHPKAGGGYTLTADGTVTNLAVLDKTGKGIREPSLTLKGSADGDLLKREDRITGVCIDGGSVTVTAGADILDVTLLEPIADAKALASGKARVNLTGDLGRWRSRVGPLVGFPNEWELGGTARQASAVVTFGDTITAKQVKLSVANAVFRGAGLDINEPLLGLETSDQDGGAITYDRTSGVTAFTFATLTGETLSGSTKRFEIKPAANGEYGASGKANVVARLDRLQRTLKLQSDPALADQFRGTAEGTVSLNASTFDKLGLTGDLTVTGFEFGPPKAPTWTEPRVQAKFDGEYAVTADTLTLRSAEVKRDGLTATGRGSVGKLTTAVDLDLTGDLTYDLTKLEPQLKQYLGKTATAVGKDTRPYRIAGSLSDGGKNLTATVGGKPAHGDLTHLSGNAAVAWTALKAYGFDVGQSEVKATLDNGLMTMTPVQATFGGGKIKVEPTVRLNPGAYDLTFQKGRIIDNAKLTPAACADAVGYALPALANSAQADGTISFDLADNRIPLADPTRGMVKGNLTVHDATVSPGPVVTELIEVFGLAAPKLQVKKNSVVPIRMENGRVYHADFVFNVGNTPVTTAGSVGTDGTLDLTVSVPIGGTLAEKLVPGNRPLIHKALAQQSITVAINGTLQKPTLNREAMKGQLAKVVQGAIKDATKDAVKDAGDDLLKKGLDGLFKKK